MEWQPISTAPFDCDLELAVIGYDGVHALVFPCRRILRSWVNAETKERIEVRPTHWREWQDRLVRIELEGGDEGNVGFCEEKKMTKNPTATGRRGLAISALDPWAPSAGRTRQLLTDDERARLTVMSSIVRFKKREIIYREGDPADAIFNINAGVVAAYKAAPDGREHITAFLFADDLFGLSTEGKYTNCTRAITDVIAYRLPVATLRSRLPKEAELEFHVICKLCQELRQAQHHGFLLSEKKAVTKLAMFLQLIEQLQIAKGQQITEIYLPMDRSDVGNYIGMTLAAVSRAFRTLTARGVIKLRNRGHVTIVDRDAFEKIAGDPPALPDIGLSSRG